MLMVGYLETVWVVKLDLLKEMVMVKVMVQLRDRCLVSEYGLE